MDKKTTMSEMMRELLSFFFVEEFGLFFFSGGHCKSRSEFTFDGRYHREYRLFCACCAEGLMYLYLAQP